MVMFVSAEEIPCDVCGQSVESCVCPPCHFCGSKGDPDCYPALQNEYHSVHGHHGMLRTQQQLVNGIEAEIRWLEKQLEYYQTQLDNVIMQDSSFRELSGNLYRRLVSK